MKSLTFTDIIALLGCITGFISLTLSIRQVWLERFKLKIHFFENENMYFDRLECCKNYRTKLQGVIRVRFENRSATPVTIFSLILSIDNTPVSTRTFEGNSFCITTYVHSDEKIESLEIPMDKQINLPLRLEPFDAYEGFIFIPFYPFTEKQCQLVKLQVKTTKGKRSKLSKIWCQQLIVDDGDGPYFQ